MGNSHSSPTNSNNASVKGEATQKITRIEPAHNQSRSLVTAQSSDKGNARSSVPSDTESEDAEEESDLSSLVVQLMRNHLLENYEMHLGITCKACNENSFFGYRYKCLVCNDYDLCDDCFQTRRTSQRHRSNHPMLIIANAFDRQLNTALQEVFESNSHTLLALLDKQEFQGINCNGCNVESIRGIRLKCDDCHNFDLCWKCYKTAEAPYTHDDSHSLIAHLWPVQTQFDMAQVEKLESGAMNGCFSSVSKVKYKGDVRALKSINPATVSHLLTFLNELRAYQEIRCNYIVKFYGFYLQENPTKLCIMMEYMQGGSLKDAIARKSDLSIRRKLFMLTSVLKGLRCIHRKGFVHKDIKPDNILLNGHGNVKIADMGIAIHDGGKNYFRDPLAPQQYAAPEILLGQKFTNKVDMFSFGLLMNELLTYTAYSGKTTNIPIRFAVKAEVLWPLVESSVKADPDARPSAEDAVELLGACLSGFWMSLDSTEDYKKMDTAKKDHLFREFYRISVPNS